MGSEDDDEPPPEGPNEFRVLRGSEILELIDHQPPLYLFAQIDANTIGCDNYHSHTSFCSFHSPVMGYRTDLRDRNA